MEIDGAAERVIGGFELARRFPQARVVYSGGSGQLTEGSAQESADCWFSLRTLRNCAGTDCSRERVADHRRKRALHAELVAPKPGERWLLVTSAHHMPRSIGVFRKAGFDVEPYPVDWRTRGWIDAWAPFDRLTTGLACADTAVHEWVGLLAYWMAARSDALFPGPRRQ